ncbi:hypothetical protein VTJ04DRAFT_4938 [Mycothermus thermophilus]|uniref:uncharacterized protein n=1 Tax=Humicola insolens TaxID=85995 RepID=UPI003744A401
MYQDRGQTGGKGGTLNSCRNLHQTRLPHVVYPRTPLNATTTIPSKRRHLSGQGNLQSNKALTHHATHLPIY